MFVSLNIITAYCTLKRSPLMVNEIYNIFLIISGLYSSIGSYNLDPWSHHYNMELSLTTVDHEVASDLEDQFYKDIEKSMEVTLSDLDKRSIFIRILHWASYHFLRLFL